MMTDQQKIAKGLICKYCGTATELADSTEVYGRKVRCRKMYICRHCGAYVLCHEGTDDAMGSTADGELRRLRHLCHQWFDAIWQNKLKRSRYNAYSWLSLRLDMNKNDVHFGLFDRQQCLRVLSLTQYYIRLHAPELWESLSKKIPTE